MPSMTFLGRLKDVARWHDWQQPETAGLRNQIEFHQKVINEYFDLFALASNELEDLAARVPQNIITLS